MILNAVTEIREKYPVDVRRAETRELRDLIEVAVASVALVDVDAVRQPGLLCEREREWRRARSRTHHRRADAGDMQFISTEDVYAAQKRQAPNQDLYGKVLAVANYLPHTLVLLDAATLAPLQVIEAPTPLKS